MRNVFWNPWHAYNYPKLKNGLEGLLAPWNGWGFGGCWSTTRRLRSPCWNLACRSASLVKLSLISPDVRVDQMPCAGDVVVPVDILVPVTLVGLRVVKVWIARIKVLFLPPSWTRVTWGVCHVNVIHVPFDTQVHTVDFGLFSSNAYKPELQPK